MRYLSAMLLLTFATTSSADDWPGWMGPGRDNIWKETGLIDSFPEGGPKVVWRTPVAGGYAGPAVAGGKVFVTDYVTSDDVKIGNFERREFTGTERVLCLAEGTGDILWKHEYPVKYTVSYPSGPRCTPNVDGDRVYTLGSEGHLFCFNVADGKIVWSRELKKDYGTKAALWGYAAHPLIDGDHLITLAGGEGSHIVALNKMTGEQVWKSTTSPEQGYSPPTIIEQAGVRQLILCRPDAVSAINPETGSEYWSVPYEATSGSIIMSPIKIGDYLYVAGYSNKSLLLKLDPEKPAAEEVWRDKRNVISPVNVQPFAVGNIIYGLDQKGVMRALEIPSGERLWETQDVIGARPRGSETAFIVQQADRFWLFNELGELIIAKLSKDGYQEIDRAQVIEKSNLAFGREVVWSMPAFASRHVYLRNDDEIICLDVSAP
ncbi:MAG: PQQ-binding-like beta-propeller repeat protein [Planctomycetaceae bacterium]|nr:PQQ-binding-like beta-propeller repeat protein [Planctomycetaceae bacterium]